MKKDKSVGWNKGKDKSKWIGRLKESSGIKTMSRHGSNFKRA
jgi:hypothetical protein